VVGKPGIDSVLPSVLLGVMAGTAIALIFFLRLRIEELHGKTATQQASLGGFETEDVLYLLPLVTLSNALVPMLLVASICAPLYAIWVVIDYQRAVRRNRGMAAASCSA
jgi:archaetidylinositol phosphate synthase